MRLRWRAVAIFFVSIAILTVAAQSELPIGHDVTFTTRPLLALMHNVAIRVDRVSWLSNRRAEVAAHYLPFCAKPSEWNRFRFVSIGAGRDVLHAGQVYILSTGTNMIQYLHRYNPQTESKQFRTPPGADPCGY